jgi:L-lactate utilization protein LutC
VRVALFVTCFNDALYPQTGKAVVRLLERLGHDVAFPTAQTCCGQMHVNTGYYREAVPLAHRFLEVFDPYEAIVSPSPSCVGTVREWTAALDGVGVVRDGDPRTLSAADLDRVDGAFTGVAVGIAETGTFVLDGGPQQGTRPLSLVPDVLVCVVRTDQVVDDVPAAVQRLGADRPLTWISGPSATSDIELDRVEGVPGPRTLHVLVVEP